jgi:hypothetical protein
MRTALIIAAAAYAAFLAGVVVVLRGAKTRNAAERDADRSETHRDGDS